MLKQAASLLSIVLFAASLAAQIHEHPRSEQIPNEFIVRLAAPPEEGALIGTDMRVVGKPRRLGKSSNLYLIRVVYTGAPARAVEAEAVQQRVGATRGPRAARTIQGEFIGQNSFTEPLAADDPKDALYAPRQKALFDAFNIPEAWSEVGNCSASSPEQVVVAILDTGLRFTHAEFAGTWCPTPIPTYARTPSMADALVMKTCAATGWFHRDAMAKTPDAVVPWDPDGHGTQIAGVIAAVHNSAGVAGVGCGVKLLIVRMLSDSTMRRSTAADAITALTLIKELKASVKIRVVNCSWRNAASTDQKLLDEERQLIADLGPDTLVVAAAGNTGQEVNAQNLVYPAAWAKDLDNVISVTASNPDGSRPPMANYGAEYVYLAAPGVDVFTTSTHPPYVQTGGSSIAAAFVSGAAALYVAKNPNATAKQIKDRLCDSVSPDEEGWDVNPIHCGGPIDFGVLFPP